MLSSVAFLQTNLAFLSQTALVPAKDEHDPYSKHHIVSCAHLLTEVQGRGANVLITKFRPQVVVLQRIWSKTCADDICMAVFGS